MWLGATPLLVAFLLALATPLIGLVLVWLSNGRLAWLDLTRKRPSMFAAAFPTAGLFAAVIGWMHIISGGGLIAILAALTTLIAVGIAYFRRHPADDDVSVGMTGLFAAILSFGLLAVANAALGGAPSHTYAVAVIRAYESHGRRSTFYHVVLGPWADQPSNDVTVTRGLYLNTATGGVLCVFDHTGVLQARWFYLDKCPIGVSSAMPAMADN